MYRDHYGLIDKPFKPTPDPKYFFGQAGHAEARDLLCYGVREREGLLCFIGVAGTGKTTLLRTALEGLGDDCATALVVNPRITAEDLLRVMLVDFGVVPRTEIDSDVARQLGAQEMISYLEHFLLDLARQGRTAVLAIDEAHAMTPAVLETVRALTNLETTRHKLLQIVLVGQPSLHELLSRPEVDGLAQRVAVRYTLRPLDERGVASYLDHRLRVAGSLDRVRFASEAAARIRVHSEGLPRLVNLLADRSLMAGFAAQSDTISAAMVDAAASTLGIGGETEPSVEREAPIAAAAPESVPAGFFDREPEGDAGPEPAAPSDRADSSHDRVADDPLVMPLPDNGFRPWQAVVGVAVALIVTVGGYAGWQRQQVPQLPTTPPSRADGSLSTAGGSAQFGTGMPVTELGRPAGDYTIYLSSHRNLEDAGLVMLRRQLADAGHVSFLVAADVPGRGTLYRLTVGEFAHRDAATRAASDLRATLGLAHAEPVAVADVAGS